MTNREKMEIESRFTQLIAEALGANEELSKALDEMTHQGYALHLVINSLVNTELINRKEALKIVANM